MYTPLPNYSIKETARNAIRGRLWYFWQMALIIYLIGVASSYILKFALGANYPTDILSGTVEREAAIWPTAVVNLYNLLYGIATLPLTYGLAYNMVKLVRGYPDDKPYASIFNGYKPAANFWRLALTWVIITLKTVLYALLLIIPGIIKALALSQAPMIAYDEPNLSASDACKKSEDMMRGFKGRLFLLNLSFIGWALLVPLTLGILTVWLIPYMQAANAKFYDEVRRAYYNGDPATSGGQDASNGDGSGDDSFGARPDDDTVTPATPPKIDEGDDDNWTF